MPRAPQNTNTCWLTFRIAAGELTRLQKLSERHGLMAGGKGARSRMARAALSIGLAAIESDPSVLTHSH